MLKNEDEFWQALEPHREVIWKLAYALTGSYDEASDLASETFLAAYKQFSTLRNRDAFRKFLSTITVRLHRRKQWRNRIFLRMNDGFDYGYEPVKESSYDLDLLLASLMKLPSRQRQTIVLFELSGLSLEEIRKIQGGTLSGVKSRLARARQTLRKLLKDDEYVSSLDLGSESRTVFKPMYTIQTP